MIGKEDPARYGRAAVRWHGRLALEAKQLELAESQLALAALAALPTDETAFETLIRIARRHGVPGFGS